MNKHFKAIYDALLVAAENPASELWYKGVPHRGASHRCAFWDGAAGVRSPMNVPQTMTAVCYRAGAEWAKRQITAGKALPENMIFRFEKSQ